MSNVGCIVMYSKPIDDNKTMPCGTVFYTDGTSKEVSLKEAANCALNMALEYGYVNAIENERYFNVTFEEFVSNREKYEEIAKKNDTKTDDGEIIDVYTNEHEVKAHEEEKNPDAQTIKTSIESDINKKNLPDFVREVEPPMVVKDGTNDKKDEVDLNEIEEKLNEALNNLLDGNGDEKVPTQNDLDSLINEQNARSK